MNVYQLIVIAIFIFMSVIGFLTMYADKKKAEKGKWRISERALFAVAALLGGVGSTAGMYVFRHKTKHWYFKYGMPLLAVWSIAASVALMYFLK